MTIVQPGIGSHPREHTLVYGNMGSSFCLPPAFSSALSAVSNGPKKNRPPFLQYQRIATLSALTRIHLTSTIKIVVYLTGKTLNIYDPGRIARVKVARVLFQPGKLKTATAIKAGIPGSPLIEKMTPIAKLFL
jgi:hypothetical protein